MDFYNLNKAIDKLEEKQFELLSLYNSLQKNYEKLKEENKNLQQTVKEQKELIKSLQTQNKMRKIVSSLAVKNENKTVLKKKLDECISEIDRCISFLVEKNK